MKLSTSTKNQETQKNSDPILEVIFSKNGSAKEKYESVGFFYNKILQIFRIKPTLDAFHLSQLKKEDKTLVLTFGTGGFLLEKIITTVKPIHRVHGIDFSKKMHAITNQRLSRLNIQDKVELKLENVLNMPYDSESFDVIFAIHILDIMKIDDIPCLLLQIRRVLKPNGSIWVGGTYHNIYLVGYLICYELGLEILNEILWHKLDATPNMSCTRFVADHENFIWARKGDKHTFNYEIMKDLNHGKQMRSVWPSGKTLGGKKVHPTQKPEWLIERIVLATSKENDVVFDPFMGSGTTAVICKKLNRRFIGCEINPEYVEIANKRLSSIF